MTLMEAILWLGNGEGAALELAQKFIGHGYNVNSIWDGRMSDTNHILQQWNRAILELFIKNGLNLNQVIHREHPQGCTWTPLLKVIEIGDKQLVKILLDTGRVDLTQKANPYANQPPLSPSGPQTPLSFAISRGKTRIAELLREYGATL